MAGAVGVSEGEVREGLAKGYQMDLLQLHGL